MSNINFCEIASEISIYIIEKVMHIDMADVSHYSEESGMDVFNDDFQEVYDKLYDDIDGLLRTYLDDDAA